MDCKLLFIVNWISLRRIAEIVLVYGVYSSNYRFTTSSDHVPAFRSDESMCLNTIIYDISFNIVINRYDLMAC